MKLYFPIAREILQVIYGCDAKIAHIRLAVKILIAISNSIAYCSKMLIETFSIQFHVKLFTNESLRTIDEYKNIIHAPNIILNLKNPIKED